MVSPDRVAKISGPLLDRIDLHIEMPPVDPKQLRQMRAGRSSGDIGVEVAASPVIAPTTAPRLAARIMAGREHSRRSVV